MTVSVSDSVVAVSHEPRPVAFVYDMKNANKKKEIVGAMCFVDETVTVRIGDAKPCKAERECVRVDGLLMGAARSRLRA